MNPKYNTSPRARRTRSPSNALRPPNLRNSSPSRPQVRTFDAYMYYSPPRSPTYMNVFSNPGPSGPMDSGRLGIDFLPGEPEYVPLSRNSRPPNSARSYAHSRRETRPPVPIGRAPTPPLPPFTPQHTIRRVEQVNFSPARARRVAMSELPCLDSQAHPSDPSPSSDDLPYVSLDQGKLNPEGKPSLTGEGSKKVNRAIADLWESEFPPQDNNSRIPSNTSQVQLCEPEEQWVSDPIIPAPRSIADLSKYEFPPKVDDSKIPPTSSSADLYKFDLPSTNENGNDQILQELQAAANALGLENQRGPLISLDEARKRDQLRRNNYALAAKPNSDAGPERRPSSFRRVVRRLSSVADFARPTIAFGSECAKKIQRRFSGSLNLGKSPSKKSLNIRVLPETSVSSSPRSDLISLEEAQRVAKERRDLHSRPRSDLVSLEEAQRLDRERRQQLYQMEGTSTQYNDSSPVQLFVESPPSSLNLKRHHSASPGPQPWDPNSHKKHYRRGEGW